MSNISTPFAMGGVIGRTCTAGATPTWQPRHTAMFSMADAFERAYPAAPARDKSPSLDTMVWFTMSDAFERAYAASLRDTFEPSRSGQLLRKLGHGLRRALKAVSRSINDVLNAQAEARARDQRYSHTPW